MLGTATLLMFPSIWPENFCIIGRFNGPEPPEQRKRRQNRGHALAEEGGPCHACHAHLKGRHKQNIQADVAQRRGNEEIERRLESPSAVKIPVQTL